ncbi:MAG: LysR family transcriptional regulator [Spirochaetales bacterium]|nr:LysR family transcriptional regulator [Spirochaetales bacterium]
MDLYKLKSFYTVAELGSFSRAAESLFLTQPAVSAQIKDLEYEYKTKLFDRVGRKIKLTRAGETLIGYAKKLLDMYEESHFAVNMLKEAMDGSVKITTSGTPGSRLLPTLISNFKKVYPDTDFVIKTQKSVSVVESIKQNHFDLGIIVSSECNMEKHELIEKILYKDQIVIGVSNEHPLALRNSISVNELSNMPLIVSVKNTVSRQAMDKFFHQYSIPFTIAYEIENMSMIKTMVEKNLGIAFFSSLEIRKEVDSKWLHTVEIEDVPLYRYVNIIYHRNHELSPATKAFYDFIFNPDNQTGFLRNNQKNCF